MKHFVFVLGSYHPNYSAVGVCVKNIVDEIKKNNKVTVVCYKTTFNQLETECFEGVKIVRVSSKLNSFLNKMQYLNINTKGFKKYLYFTMVNLIRTYRYLSAILSIANVQKDVVNALYNSLNHVSKSSNIDVIVPCCFPIESLVASEKFIKSTDSEIKLIPYLFDDFIESIKLHRTKWNKKIKYSSHVKVLNTVFSKAYHILAMDSLKNTFEKNYPLLQDKFSYLEHPLLIKPENNSPGGDIAYKEEVSLTYAGSFLKGYVNPDYFFEVLNNQSLENFKIKLYVRGDCNDLIDKYIEESINDITNYGSVSFEEALLAIKESDILINVGETSGTQISSKIFTYMSFGKPIIHFYSVDHDINKKFLNKYPLAICIKEDMLRLDENATLLKNFVLSNRFKNVGFELVCTLFHDAQPKYTSKIMEELSYGFKPK